MLSSHPLAVERLRYQERYRPVVPHPWRLCRFCRLEVEDEVHALLKCQVRSDLLALRAAFTQDVTSLIGEMLLPHDLLQRLMLLLHDKRLTVRWLSTSTSSWRFSAVRKCSSQRPVRTCLWLLHEVFMVWSSWWWWQRSFPSFFLSLAWFCEKAAVGHLSVYSYLFLCVTNRVVGTCAGIRFL